MRPLEIAACVVTGHDGTLAPSASGERNPRRALELVVLEALRRPPCGVAFSGGRDSSAVLAVAVHVARREGLAEPIPITKVFPDVPTTEEQSWQERVIDHLRLDDWQRVVIHDELDLLGPLATANLVDHGVVWPPTIHGDRPVIDRVRGGSLIDGEGGDEVLGVTAHRIAPVTTLVRSPRSVTPVRLRRAAVALLPKRLRARRVRDRWSADPLPWLRPVAAAALADAVGGEEAAAPLSFAASLTQIPRQRAQVLGARNREYFARARNVELSSPLLHPDVVHALAAQGGFFGVGSRTATLRALVSDLLPDDVLTRADQGHVQRRVLVRPRPSIRRALERRRRRHRAWSTPTRCAAPGSPSGRHRTRSRWSNRRGWRPRAHRRRHRTPSDAIWSPSFSISRRRVTRLTDQTHVTI